MVSPCTHTAIMCEGDTWRLSCVAGVCRLFAAAADAMDVYVPPRGPIQLLDFSPISNTTNPLCFDWKDLPYTHMHQQDQQQQDHSSSPRQQHPPHSQQQHGGCSTPSSSSSRRSVELRVVEHEGMIVPGARVATGMPYDMLGLPDAVGAVMAAMQQQQLQ